MDAADHWSMMAETPFVSLGTFRKSGEVVATPVWIAADGEDLVVTTERATGKVKRLRNDARVTLQPCSRSGNVEPDAVTVAAVAHLDGDPASAERATAALSKKYGFQFSAFLGVEKFVRRVQRREGDRVIIRITRETPS